ncbi:MAG: hypothetical protein JG776_1321 [Caloramator sp.]|uniref:hypothetical protein n=1 Tax=Caloramator sp. TaxID=1871330 RepID=UPI001D37291A|nr:hypothetical protein [Caloramator sp.]MBZ4663606.1 hypothetical protein [Caloramator sp.]
MGRSKNKYIILLISILILLFTAGCKGTAYQRSLYDDDKKIVSDGDSYTYGLRSGMTVNNKTTIKFGRFTGMETIYYVEAKKNSKIKIDFNAKIKTGHFKVVFIDANNNITKILEGTLEGSVDLDVLKGTGRIKFVGRDAAGEISLKIYPADDVEIIKKSENF